MIQDVSLFANCWVWWSVLWRLEESTVLMLEMEENARREDRFLEQRDYVAAQQQRSFVIDSTTAQNQMQIQQFLSTASVATYLINGPLVRIIRSLFGFIFSWLSCKKVRASTAVFAGESIIDHGWRRGRHISNVVFRRRTLTSSSCHQAMAFPKLNNHTFVNDHVLCSRGETGTRQNSENTQTKAHRLELGKRSNGNVYPSHSRGHSLPVLWKCFKQWVSRPGRDIGH